MRRLKDIQVGDTALCRGAYALTSLDQQPDSLRRQVVHAYTKSLSTIWIVDTPLLVVCFVMGASLAFRPAARSLTRSGDPPALFLKNYDLKQRVIRAPRRGEPSQADVEGARDTTFVNGDTDVNNEKEDVDEAGPSRDV